MGVGTAAQRRQLTKLGSTALTRYPRGLAGVPQAVSTGDIEFQQFLEQAFSTLVPHVDTLVTTAVDRLPSVAIPFVLALDDQALGSDLAQQPNLLAVLIFFLQDPVTAGFIQEASAQAGQDCGYNGCSSLDLKSVLRECAAGHARRRFSRISSTGGSRVVILAP